MKKQTYTKTDRTVRDAFRPCKGTIVLLTAMILLAFSTLPAAAAKIELTTVTNDTQFKVDTEFNWVPDTPGVVGTTTEIADLTHWWLKVEVDAYDSAGTIVYAINVSARHKSDPCPDDTTASENLLFTGTPNEGDYNTYSSNTGHSHPGGGRLDTYETTVIYLDPASDNSTFVVSGSHEPCHIPCDCGQFDNGTACKPCPCGTYSYGGRENECIPCPSGQIAAEGSCSCDSCEIGQEPAEDNCTCVEVPSAIALTALEAIPGNRTVTLAWETGDEEDNMGFNIYRAESEDGTYIQINNTIIPAEGLFSGGAEYRFVDDGVRNRNTYYYKIEDIDNHAVSTQHGPVSATPRLIYGLTQ